VIPGEWFDRALCAQTDPDMFNPDRGVNTPAAKAICAQCDVTTKCLEYALVNDIRHGVMGGMPARDRRPLHAAHNREAS
jgi:WhiB family redox-sensing transcriptional regulator